MSDENKFYKDFSENQIRKFSENHIRKESNYQTLINGSWTIERDEKPTKPEFAEEFSPLDEQIKDLQKSKYELSQIRGVLAVNFSKYDGCKSKPENQIWKTTEEFEKESTYSALIKALVFLCEKKD